MKNIMTKKQLQKIEKQNKYYFKLIRSRKALYYSFDFDQLFVRPHLMVKEKESPIWQKRLIFIDWADDLGIQI